MRGVAVTGSASINMESPVNVGRRIALERIERGISRTVGYAALVGAVGFMVTLLV